MKELYIYLIIAFFCIMIQCLQFNYEKFSSDNSLHKLISPENLLVLFGNTLPLNPDSIVLSEQCANNNAPSVTENNNDPHSLFEFTYNKCHPSCCKTSSFSCDHGCVCVTDDQVKFLQNRGGNKHPRNPEEIDY